MRFLGLQLEDRVPGAKTVWLYRERLKALNLVDVLFARFHEQLATQAYVARAGQMIDATFVEVPRQRNRREENAKIKAGEIPEGDDAEAKAKRSQKNTDARWTKKNNETHYGYKDAAVVDCRMGHRINLCSCLAGDNGACSDLHAGMVLPHGSVRPSVTPNELPTMADPRLGLWHPSITTRSPCPWANGTTVPIR
jgi:hypothetical protein